METKGSLARDNSLPNKNSESYFDEKRKIPKSILQGRFELKAELGAGAHGKIFQGRDKHLKSNIAIKLVLIQILHFSSRWKNCPKINRNSKEKFH